MTRTVDVRDHYVAEFLRLPSASASPSWLTRMRESAANRFQDLDFPTTDLEDWRFTDVSPIAEIPFRRAGRAAGLELSAGITDGPLRACQLAFVNGAFDPRVSSALGLPEGVRAGTLAEALATDPAFLEPHLARHDAFDRHAFAALNLASFQDGAVVHVPRGVVVAEPIHVLFVAAADGEPQVTHPRVLVVLEEGAQATVVESYVGQGAGVYFTNAATDVVLAAGAVCHHYKLQRESVQAFHVATLAAHLGRESTFVSHAIALGGAIARNDLHARLGHGADCTLNGLYEATGRQLVDHHTTIDHDKPHGSSRQLYKGVLSGQAHGVFNGKVIVRENAQKTDAVQSNKNLLLSDDAVIDTKPELLIFANDVKCKHGATIGQLDPDMLYYLRSRGIGREAARRLLVHAFSSEILDHVRNDAIRAQLGGCLLTMAPAGMKP